MYPVFCIPSHKVFLNYVPYTPVYDTRKWSCIDKWNGRFSRHIVVTNCKIKRQSVEYEVKSCRCNVRRKISLASNNLFLCCSFAFQATLVKCIGDSLRCRFQVKFGIHGIPFLASRDLQALLSPSRILLFILVTQMQWPCWLSQVTVLKQLFRRERKV